MITGLSSAMHPDNIWALFSEMKIADLTQTLFREDNTTPYTWELFKDKRDAGGSYGGKIALYEHSGTHVDAPVHFVKGGKTLDELPPDIFFAPIALIDVRDRTLSNRDYMISSEDIERWEEEYGRIKEKIFVFFWTGWDGLWRDRDAFLGLDKEGVYHFPGLHEDAAATLVERGVKGVGTDCYAIDAGSSLVDGKYPAHKVLLPSNIYVIEVLSNLKELPPLGAYCIALPLKLQKGTGSPARVLAIVPR